MSSQKLAGGVGVVGALQVDARVFQQPSTGCRGLSRPEAASRGGLRGRDDPEGDALTASTTVESLMPCFPRSTALLPAFSPPQGAYVMQLSTATTKGSSPMVLSYDSSAISSSVSKHPGFDPLIVPTTQRAHRTRLVGDPLIGAPEHQLLA